MFDFDTAIRKVPNFPKPGILFYDITSLVANPEAMSSIKNEMVSWAKTKNISKVVAVESRGFLFAPLIAESLKVPIVLARKKGKLPNETISEEYALEYGTDIIEMQKIDLMGDGNVIIIDDLIATGGTLKAVANLIEKNSKLSIVGFFSVIGLPFLNYESILKGYDIKTIINYHNE